MKISRRIKKLLEENKDEHVSLVLFLSDDLTPEMAETVAREIRKIGDTFEDSDLRVGEFMVIGRLSVLPLAGLGGYVSKFFELLRGHKFLSKSIGIVTIDPEVEIEGVPMFH